MSPLLKPEVRERVLAKHAELRDAGQFLSFERLHTCRAKFYDRFGPKRLPQLNGKELLETLFLMSSKASLVYWLEYKNDEEMPNVFGGIGGGSAYKFILFKQRESGQWMTGSPRIPRIINEKEAILLASELRDQLVAGYEVLKPLGEHSSLEDYRKVNIALKEVAPHLQHTAFTHKYYSLLFPDLLDDFHALEWQRHHLRRLAVPVDAKGDRYEYAFYFKTLSAELEISLNELTGTLNVLQGLPRRYWRIGTSFDGETKLWPVFKKDGVVAIGWGDLGDLTNLSQTQPAKVDLANRLKGEFGQTHGPTASRKAGEIKNFRHKIERGDVVVAADGQSIWGIGLVTDDYRYVPKAELQTMHRIPVEWQVVPSTALRLPIPSEGLQTTCKELKEDRNIRYIENQLQVALSTPGAASKPGTSSTANDRMPPLLPKVLRIKSILDRKGQVILYGPPGTGKTYWARIAARELAARKVYKRPYDLLDAGERGEVDGVPGKEGFVRACTFHPAYGYEDFLEGYRPKATAGALAFERRNGLFKRLCADAAKAPDKAYFLLVDEINRGDIPRIFGELLTLLEMDKRGMVVNLPTSGDPFSVPSNVFVIGTMNTADRSIALLDTALRRRFGFVELMPDYDLLQELVLDSFPVGEWLKLLNASIRKRLGNDGRNLQIGHAYFLHNGKPIPDAGTFAKVLQEDVIPLLEEYFYDAPDHLPHLLGNAVVDQREQRIADHLFETGRREELFRALASVHPELATASVALNAEDEEDEDDEEAPDTQ